MTKFIKVFLIIPLVISLSAVSARDLRANGYIFESQVQEMLECVRGVLKSGIAEVDLPSFEPLRIAHFSLNVSDLGISDASGHVTINNATIAGITDWLLSDLHIDPVIIGGLGGTLRAHLALPALTLDTAYNTELNIKGIHVFGDGTLHMALGHLQFAIDVKLLLSRLNLAKFRVAPGLEEIDFKITGFLNDDEQSALVTQLVNEIAVDWINEKSEDFADVIEEFLQGIVNNRSQRVNINDIINAILERCPLPI